MLVLWDDQTREGGSFHEEFPVYGGAGCLCSPAGGGGHAGDGDLPEDGHCRADLLPVEEEVPGYGRGRGEEAACPGGGEPEAEAAGADLSLDKQMLQDVLRKKP